MLIALFSIEIDWGVKYGAGYSSIIGKDLRYNLHYDFTVIDTATTNLGYLKLSSERSRYGVSNSGGLYLNTMLIKNIDSIWLQSELLWQRYKYAYNFQGNCLSTNSLLLSTQFADTLNGSINQTLDYITVPVLIKLKQGLSEDNKDDHYQGAFIYFGPSFSMLLSNNSTKHRGIEALDDDIAEFVDISYHDSNSAQVYSSKKYSSASDEVLTYKASYIVGFGFNLKDIFNFGFGKDEFVIDCRFDIGAHPIGNATNSKNFKLYSTILSIGCKL